MVAGLGWWWVIWWITWHAFLLRGENLLFSLRRWIWWLLISSWVVNISSRKKCCLVGQRNDVHNYGELLQIFGKISPYVWRYSLRIKQVVPDILFYTNYDWTSWDLSHCLFCCETNQIQIIWTKYHNPSSTSLDGGGWSYSYINLGIIIVLLISNNHLSCWIEAVSLFLLVLYALDKIMKRKVEGSTQSQLWTWSEWNKLICLFQDWSGFPRICFLLLSPKYKFFSTFTSDSSRAPFAFHKMMMIFSTIRQTNDMHVTHLFLLLSTRALFSYFIPFPLHWCPIESFFPEMNNYPPNSVVESEHIFKINEYAIIAVIFSIKPTLELLPTWSNMGRIKGNLR